jgi:hypothetical protein
MARQSLRSLFPVLAALALLILSVWPCAAAAQDADARIQAHLQAGEFAPALALARQAADVRQRDAWLGQIAAAQAQAGARDASFRSAAEIGDDRARARTLAQAAATPLGAQGGGPNADFDSLMDLITSTVQPTTWDGVGGPGSIAPFPTGVWVDPQGVLQPLLKEEAGWDLAALRAANAPKGRQDSARRNTTLRMISLPKLEKQVQLCLAAGRQPSEEMQVLAGLQRIKYVFVYPESGDIVVAGPAGDWTTGPEGAVISRDSGAPLLRLDDLVVVLRHMMSGPDAKFGCLITPRKEALARARQFIDQSGRRPITAEWMKQLRTQLGRQDIEVYGLDPRTRAARVMVEADYRMKLVGWGLEEGVQGVDSCLNLIQVRPGETPPPMGVIRWWFALNYEAITASKDRQAFAIRGQGVKVLSEDEKLTAEGEQVHTGQSEGLSREFAQRFTAHFEALCRKYPIYAELRNLCDLALIGALVREEDLAGRNGWHMTCFGDTAAYQVELAEAPKEVDTIANYRVIQQARQKHTIVGVSGGVSVQPAALVKRRAIETESYPALENQRSTVVPKKVQGDAWWWDGVGT